MKYSVIIPTYNEESHLRQCIKSVRNSCSSVEIIIADGGSTDKTIEIANEEMVYICKTMKSRGIQCNSGTAMASGEILLFLHADTLLPNNAFDMLTEWFNDERVQVGTFHLTFDVSHPLLNLYSIFSRFDSVFTRFGDQCIVVRKSFYEMIGRLPEFPLYEDVRFLQLARRQTKIYSFPSAVTTSARRFLLHGIIRQQLSNAVSIIQYLMGRSPENLSLNYNKETERTIPTAILCFARFPHPGKVKTRLARTLGNSNAAELYKACVEHIFNECNLLSFSVTKYLFYSDEDDASNIEQWVPPSFRCFFQSGENLGERMKNALTHAFNNSSKRVIIIGTDIPDLSAHVIKNAISLLDESDVVIGPAHDGGYYLIGMNKFYPDLFTEIRWSTNVVFEQTMSVIHNLNLRVQCLPMLMDIDTETDLTQWSNNVNVQTNHPLYKVVRKFQNIPSIESV